MSITESTSESTKEIFKDIPNYEGIYRVSTLGKIWSMPRLNSIGSKIGGYFLKAIIDNNYYLVVSLHKNEKQTKRSIHQLVAEAFLGFKQNGHISVVNHINFDKLDNRLLNLEIVTARENTNRKHLPSSSQYTGVSWHKRIKKWGANIEIDRKRNHLGYFINEYQAHLAYQQALKNL